MTREHLVAGLVASLMAILGGFCVQDYRTATRQALDATIVGGKHVPGHYETSCSYDEDHLRHCSTDWVPPTWSVDYADEGGVHTESVDEKLYQALPVGQKVYVAFWQGGGVFGARYHVRFSTTRPARVEQ